MRHDDAVEENDGLGMDDAVSDFVALSFGLGLVELSLVLAGARMKWNALGFVDM